MHRYFIKTPWFVKKLFPSYVWQMPDHEKAIYLSFDDGPHPDITPWVLDELKKFHAKASFFCIGNNVAQFPDVYERILSEGHAVGNHTYHHLNGWKASADVYAEDVSKAAALIHSNLFRPPYGRIKTKQVKYVCDALKMQNPKIIMWDVLSADFDKEFSPEQCLHHVLKNVVAGSIVVFHDSQKAFKNLNYALPRVLQELNKQGYQFKKIDF